MNKKITLGIIVLLMVGIGFYLTLKPKSDNPFNYNEIIKGTIGPAGGVLENNDKSISVTFPPLKQETEFTLSFKKSSFKVNDGIGSPVTVSIYPDLQQVSLQEPLYITVQYSPNYKLPIPYFIDQNNRLHLAAIKKIDKQNHYLTITTFHGGDYSWIYAE